MWDNAMVIFEVLIPQFIWLMMPARHMQEILMLRKELQALKRGAKRPILTSWGRLFFVLLIRLNEHVVGNIVTISPNTVLAWHRKLAARRIVGELRQTWQNYFKINRSQHREYVDYFNQTRSWRLAVD